MRALFPLGLPLIASCLLIALPVAASIARYPGDARQIGAMQPKARELLEKGEALAVAGNVPQALELFRKALAEDPSPPLLHRRECEALTALGRRAEAVQACTMAAQNSRSNIDSRALVRALVDGPLEPQMRDLFQALTITSIERRGSPGLPAPLAMTCDVAQSIGDVPMLQRCAERLERDAPGDPQLRRAKRALSLLCPPWRFWGGWLAIVAAVAWTVGDWLRREVGARRGRRIAAATVAVGLCLVTRAVHADPVEEAPRTGWLSKWTIDDAHPENSIPSESDRNADPLNFGYWLQDMALKAEHASKLGRHEAAASFYNALALAVPERAIAYSKMCNEWEAAGNHEKAVDSCGKALLHDGVTIADYTHFVRLVIKTPGDLGEKEKGAVNNVLKHLSEDPAARAISDELACEMGVRTSNLDQLRQCTEALQQSAPDDPKTVTYQWNLAMLEGKFDVADALVKRASALGVPAASMQRVTDAGAAARRRRLQTVYSILGFAVLLGASVLVGNVFWRRRLKVA